MKEYRTERLRNVGLFSHGGAGKTSLAEAMLFNAGVVTRLGRVVEGTTTSDFEPDEIRRQISVNLALLPFEWHDHKINLIDSPGYVDFIGEVIEAIQVVDAAIVLVDAVAGVEVGTELVWRRLDQKELPRLVYVNRIDRENADFFGVVERLRARFGPRCIAVQIPVGSQQAFDGVVDLVQMKAYLGGEGEAAAVPAGVADQAAEYREKLLEAVCETDDELITKYLEGETVTDEELVRALRTGITSGQIVPVLVGSALQNRAVQPLQQAIVDLLPSPAEARPAQAHNLQANKEEELSADPNAPLAAFVFKTTADPYVGKLTYIRVYSGTLSSDSHVWNANRSRDERIGQLLLRRGKNQEPIVRLVAGDIGAVAKLTETVTSDTLCGRDRPYRLPEIEFPKPLFSASVQPKTKADLDKLGSALSRIVEEDPTLHVRRDAETSETVMSGMGEQHIDVAVDKMKRKFGVDVVVSTPKVPYRETITASTNSGYRHKKQTGGAGQFAEVHISLEPQPRGVGFEFVDKVVGGAVPRQYIPAVEKGVVEALQDGIIAHYPVVDVKVALFDGKDHPVDSSEMAFKIASIQAFKQGMQQAKPVLLEPIMNVRVTLPEQFMGDVIGDLNGRRAKVHGMMPEGGIAVIDAEVPLAEMLRYSAALRSVTQGQGIYEMDFSHYEEVPAHIAQQIVAESKKEHEKA